MTISVLTARVPYTGDGSTEVFSVPFAFNNTSEVAVWLLNQNTGVQQLLTLHTDYEVAGAGAAPGGSVTLVSAGQAWLDAEGDLNTGYKIVVLRAVPLTQTSDIRNADRLHLDRLEAAYDRAVQQCQMLKEIIDRCIKFPETDENAATLLSAIQRAGAYHGFDGSGNLSLINAGSIQSPDVIWSMAGTVVTDANDMIFIHQVRRFESFVGFDVTAVTAPTGQAMIIDFERNGVVEPTWRLTLPAGQKYAETLVAVSTSMNDKIRPKIVQAGNLEPGKTICMRMRGL
jgi:hypothetical protein